MSRHQHCIKPVAETRQRLISETASPMGDDPYTMHQMKSVARKAPQRTENENLQTAA